MGPSAGVGYNRAPLFALGSIKPPIIWHNQIIAASQLGIATTNLPYLELTFDHLSIVPLALHNTWATPRAAIDHGIRVGC